MALVLRPVTDPSLPVHAAILAAEGSVDLENAPVLEKALEALLAAGKTQVAIDCAAVRYVNSSGFGVLIKVATALEERGGGLSLLGIPAKVRIVVEMLGIEQVFAVVCAQRPAALAA